MRLRSVLLLIVISTSVTACWSRARPNVLLIVIDTLRADRLGCYGNPLGLTPFMDGLAKRGVVFENAYAPSSWTSPSVASLFTSRYPTQHQVIRHDTKLSQDEITLAEKLKTASYFSGGFSANLLAGPAMGFGQGFDMYRYIAPTKTEGIKTRAPRLQSKALKWLEDATLEPQKLPRLLFLQYLEPHNPYEPPEPFRTRFLREGDDAADAETANGKLSRFEMGKITPAEDHLLESLYDGEVANIDSNMKALFDDLERRQFLENAIVVITSDHGEEFRDHGAMGHGSSLYREVTHVPLIVVGPGLAAGRVVNENVSLVDVGPTLLDLLEIPPEPRFEGRSLVALLKGGAEGAQVDVISELLPKVVGRPDFRRHVHSLIRASLAFLVSPGGDTELYDLAKDPHEKDDDPASLSNETAVLQAALDRRLNQLAESKSAQESRELDAATQEKLRQLGYGH